MAQARSPQPLTRTYLGKTISSSGRERIHVRIYSPRHDLDKRGTAATIEGARRRALAGVPAPRPRRPT
jgi:hypothetical protein